MSSSENKDESKIYKPAAERAAINQKHPLYMENLIKLQQKTPDYHNCIVQLGMWRPRADQPDVYHYLQPYEEFYKEYNRLQNWFNSLCMLCCDQHAPFRTLEGRQLCET